jgi:hypothetical protein
MRHQRCSGFLFAAQPTEKLIKVMHDAHNGSLIQAYIYRHGLLGWNVLNGRFR